MHAHTGPAGPTLGLTLSALACGALLTGCGSAASAPGSGVSTPSITSGSSGSAGPPRAAATIVIKDFTFRPARLTVTPGAKITVRNEDSAPHTVTALNRMFDTGDITGGRTTTFTAPPKGGTYSYICTIHTYMKGVLVVS